MEEFVGMHLSHHQRRSKYQRLQVKARWAIAEAKDGRPAYDRVIKTFKALLRLA